MKLLKNLIWKYRKSNENEWKRQKPLETLTDYMTLQQCKKYMKTIVERIQDQSDVEDLNFDEGTSTIIYFKTGKKYCYSLVPAPARLEKDTGNDYCVVKAELIYSS
ncbi:hypothetical protein [Brevibacillus reuszeri]|uniref:hypothetical protein n=1 Tax=Brevibacillus reuszeri TaxID=54915 RepID=UPI000CCC04FA|nr:hypothetical protein [Brevibacillus reuszeri]